MYHLLLEFKIDKLKWKIKSKEKHARKMNQVCKKGFTLAEI